MTCIVVYKDKIRTRSRIIMGSDTGLYGDDSDPTFQTLPTPKIFARKINGGEEDFLFGQAGDCHFGDMLEQIDFRHLKVREKDRKDPGRFLKEKFVPYLKEHVNVKDASDSEVIIAIFDSAFVLDSNLGVIPVPEYGHAIGSAGLPARATLFSLHRLSTEKRRIDGYDIVRLALESAENCSMHCRAPFDYLELK